MKKIGKGNDCHEFPSLPNLFSAGPECETRKVPALLINTSGSMVSASILRVVMMMVTESAGRFLRFALLMPVLVPVSFSPGFVHFLLLVL